MPSPSQQPLGADDLNDLWDLAVDGKTSESAFGASPEASIIAWLQAAVPAGDGNLESRSRIQGATSHPAMAASPRRDGSSNPARPRFAVPPVARQFAVAALTAAVIVAVLFAQPLRDLWLPDRNPGVGSPSGPESTNFPPGTGRSLLTVVAHPGDGAANMVGFWDVTLAPGSVLHVPAALQEMGSQAIEGWIDSGTVIVGAGGFEHEVQAGNTTAMASAPEYVRNTGTEDARILLLVPMSDSETFPLRFTDGQDGEGLATPYADTFAHLIDVVPLDAREAAQYRVTVNADTYLPGVVIEPWAGSPDRPVTMRSVTVWRGEVTVDLPSDAASPEVPQMLSSGDTVLRGRSLPDGTLLVATGSENLTLLTLESMPWSENPTLDQTVDAIAPFWGEWMVPASGEVNMTVRSLWVEPGASYRLPTDAGVMYFLGSGELVAENHATGVTSTLDSGSVVAQPTGTELSFVNQSQAPAHLVQVLVFAGSLDDAKASELMQGVEATVLVQATGTLPAGMASLMLEVQEYNGFNDGGSSGSYGQSLTLLTAADGIVLVRRDGGDATLVPGNGQDPYQPPLGDGIELEPGSSMLVQPGGAFAVTGADGKPGTGLILGISPMVDSTASPQASPVATPPSTTISLRGDPGACEVVPLTVADIDNLMATPAVVDDPLARSARDLVGEPADDATVAAIVATLQGYADCTATGAYALATTYMSDQALRESETYRDLIVDNFQFVEMPGQYTTIEEIVTFPDGRAGARVVMNGEAAYITFVLEDGQWKIDVWDDSAGGPPTNNPHD